ncbi:MAG: ABC transporter permease [Anaerolineaceae bacterium]|nr:ABC transporter permease [Anaerolineaceae bacterium]
MIRQRLINLWSVILSLIAGLLIWVGAVETTGLPAFILPSPQQVWSRLIEVAIDGSLWRHIWVTACEIVLGLALGAGLAVLLGYVVAKSRMMERFLSPYLVASQAIPIVALAPLLVLWFGPGMISKVLICSLVVFFPVLVNTVVGVRAVPEELRDLMRTLHASRTQNILFLELPAALPILLGGFRIGATLAVIGAVVGEFVGSDKGLGFLVNIARGQYDTALVFVAIGTLIAMALSLYGLVILIEKRLLGWQTSSGERQ